mmetsp:Transcript_120631/g.210026  ORF Transcript_120631/g.210026 Transcript_120631/m.210026 type:complete len:295 (+) Transcript_120631:8027-8911(+)
MWVACPVSLPSCRQWRSRIAGDRRSCTSGRDVAMFLTLVSSPLKHSQDFMRTEQPFSCFWSFFTSSIRKSVSTYLKMVVIQSMNWLSTWDVRSHTCFSIFRSERQSFSSLKAEGVRSNSSCSSFSSRDDASIDSRLPSHSSILTYAISTSISKAKGSICWNVPRKEMTFFSKLTVSSLMVVATLSWMSDRASRLLRDVRYVSSHVRGASFRISSRRSMSSSEMASWRRSMVITSARGSIRDMVSVWRRLQSRMKPITPFRASMSPSSTSTPSPPPASSMNPYRSFRTVSTFPCR